MKKVGKNAHPTVFQTASKPRLKAPKPPPIIPPAEQHPPPPAAFWCT